ncbi:MAG TPA: hypothetical protein PK047_13530 [Saprospiraceae bacterium]|nr:hypothetical protein [Saprospiraceae bacterium]HRP43121.1 hypothetical protein [Saprospiraceae bacterium]
MFYKKDESLFRDQRFVYAFLLLTITLFIMIINYMQAYTAHWL